MMIPLATNEMLDQNQGQTNLFYTSLKLVNTLYVWFSFWPCPIRGKGEGKQEEVSLHYVPKWIDTFVLNDFTDHCSNASMLVNDQESS